VPAGLTTPAPLAGLDRGPVGILAGRGAVVADLAEAITGGGRAVHIVALAGFASSDLQRFPHDWVGLGQLGGMLAALRRAGCRDLVIIGGLERPDLTRLRFDLGAIRHARDIYALTRGGDDGMLRVVVRFFEGQGFTVRGIADLAPALIAPEGPIAGPALTTDQAKAITRARHALAALAPFDMGQAVVAAPDGIVAWEAAEGTQRMLARLASRGSDAGQAGPAACRMLVKLPKRGQELRIDLPTIGAETIAQARAAGLTGIAVAAGTTVLAERPALVSAAAAAGLTIAGLADDAGGAREAAATRPGLADDGELAKQVCAAAAPHARSPSGAIAAIVRRGHVLALELDASTASHLAERIASVPRGWGRLLALSRAGALHVRLSPASGARHLDVPGLVAALRKARLASVAITADDHGATVQSLAEAARLAGATFKTSIEHHGS